MIKVMSIGSGSSGNCFYAEMGGRRLLIDLGLNTKTISTALAGIGVALRDIDAVLITHTHSDHTGAVKVIQKRLCCRYYMSELSFSNLLVPDTTVLAPGRRTEICQGVFATAFETSHDCPGSIGFRLDCGDDSLGYATDLGHVSDEAMRILSGVRNLVIESNHDVQMLREGPYPYPLKRRILSDCGHLSNDDCAETVKRLAAAGARNIFLAHLSRENNTPRKAYDTVAPALQDYPQVTLRVLSPDCGSLTALD